MSRVKSISVFGATGFIGSNFCKYSKHESVAISRENMEAESRDLIYFIGTTDNYNVFTDPLIDIKINIEQLINVLESNRIKFENFNINYISSWFVYGDGVLPYREDSKCEPKGFYSISKYAAEMFLTSYCKTFGINYRILRLGNVFGAGDLGVSKKKNALQYLVNKIKNNQDIELYEGGEILRDYIHIEDVVRAIDLIIDSCPFNKVVNIGSGKPAKLKDLVNMVCLKRNSTSRIKSIPTPEFHRLVQVRDAYLDTSFLKSLGFETKKSIYEEVLNL
jgi:nucleoside-diphosphate-sugar epimerase